MLESLYSDPAAVRRLRSGTFGPWVDSFVVSLAELGYTPGSRRSQIVLVADLGRWMAQRRLPVETLDEALITAYGAQRRTQRDRRHLACLHLLEHLRALALVAHRPLQVDTSPVSEQCRRFAEHLRRERGVCPGTVGVYLATTEDFLRWTFGTGPVDMAALQAASIGQYLRHRAQRWAPRTLGNAATALRTFLRYVFAQEQTAVDLSAAVPAGPAGRSSCVPRYLSPADVEKVLATCDLATGGGRRDHAMLLLLARLGLRAGEVVRLQLDDIRWRAGELVVRGKGNFVDRLPLLPDVGEALARYLRLDRPQTPSRQVFLRRCPPRGPLVSRHAVNGVVHEAVQRAGLQPAGRASQLLRHSLGRHLIQAGASLTEIAQVLRHHASGSTEVYAKVDFEALRTLAPSWPGGGGAP
jgi:site-specific recombinase XerD